MAESDGLFLEKGHLTTARKVLIGNTTLVARFVSAMSLILSSVEIILMPLVMHC
jgi:hypothetical protein